LGLSPKPQLTAPARRRTWNGVPRALASTVAIAKTCSMVSVKPTFHCETTVNASAFSTTAVWQS
jgi:hypothetical protein